MWDLAPDFGSLIREGVVRQRGHITGGPLYQYLWRLFSPALWWWWATVRWGDVARCAVSKHGRTRRPEPAVTAQRSSWDSQQVALKVTDMDVSWVRDFANFLDSAALKLSNSLTLINLSPWMSGIALWYWSSSLQKMVKLSRLSSWARCSNSCSRLVNRLSEAPGVTVTRAKETNKSALTAHQTVPVQSCSKVAVKCKLTKQILERSFVMCHQVIHHYAPVSDTDFVHLKEAGVKQELKGLLFPCLTSILITRECRQHLRARSETGQVVWAGNNEARPQNCTDWKGLA